MMKKIPIIFIYSIMYLQTAAQMKEIFYDGFSSNKNNWGELTNVSDTIKSENGKYTVDCKENKSFIQHIPAAIKSTNDFSIGITASVTGTTYKTAGSAGLIFCSNKADSYLFTTTTDGKWSITEIKKGNSNVLKSAASKFIRQGLNVSNQLRVDKIEGRWVLYINDSSVYSMKPGKYFGHYSGFFCSGQTKAEFDDFKISGSPLITAGKLCDILPAIYESGMDGFNDILGNEVANTNDIFNDISQSTHETYYSLLQPEYDSLATIEFITPSSRKFSSTLKKCNTKYNAKQQLIRFFNELLTCMPTDYTIRDSPEDDYITIWKKGISGAPDTKIKLKWIFSQTSAFVISYDIVLDIYSTYDFK